MDEIDIWRSAKLLVDEHGDTAAIEAAMRADALLSTGDPRGGPCCGGRYARQACVKIYSENVGSNARFSLWMIPQY